MSLYLANIPDDCLTEHGMREKIRTLKEHIDRLQKSLASAEWDAESFRTKALYQTVELNKINKAVQRRNRTIATLRAKLAQAAKPIVLNGIYPAAESNRVP